MKATIFNITAIVLMVTTGFISGAKSLNNSPIEFPSEKIELSNSSYTMVEAKVINGEVMPIVELPELTITGEYNKQTMHSAKIINGEAVAVVELPELNIYSQ
jgi:hypothetical protein